MKSVALCPANHYAGWTSATICNSHVTIQIIVEGITEARVDLTRKEALNLAVSLPEIRNLIKWSKNVRETMSEADLFVHGEEELKPFEGRSNE